MIELIVLRDGREVDRYVLGAGVTTLGRGDDCELLLDDIAVSRRHARLRVERGRVLLADLGSGNGTWVGGERVRESELADGDEFTIEPFTLRLAVSRTNAGVAATRPVDATRPHEPVAHIEPTPGQPRTPGGSAPLGPRLERASPREGGPILLGGAPSERERLEFVIGRADDADIPLRDGSVSRRHAVFRCADGRFSLEDLGSANGTFVNGARLTAPRTLEDGDRLRFGDTELLYVDPTAATLSSNAPAAMPTKPVPRNAPVPSAADAREPAIELPPLPGERSPTGAMELAPVAATPEPWIAEPEPPRAEPTVDGDPPPSAFAEPVALLQPALAWEGAWDAPPAATRTETGDAAIELAPDPSPARASRGRLLVAAGAVAGALLALVVLRGAADDHTSAAEPEPDRMQRAMLLSMERLAQEGERMAAGGDFAGALAAYEQLARFGRKQELTPFRPAREGRRQAEEMVARLHEARLGNALREETLRRVADAAEVRERIQAALAVARSGLAEGRRGRLEGYDRALASLAGALALHPGHPEAVTLLAQARPERDALEARLFAAMKARLDEEGAAKLARARAAGSSAAGLRAAIRLYDEVLRDDPRGLTAWPARARLEKTRALAALANIVAPLRESAKAALAGSDPLGARKFLRTAAATHPFDPEIASELAIAQAECERHARTHLQLAKAYDDARNYAEALKEIDRVQSFADRPADKLWGQADELRRKIKAATAR